MGWTRGGPSLWGSLNATGGHKYGQGKSSKVPKAYESGRRLWVAGDWSRRCEWVQGSSASQAWEREGLSVVAHPQAGGWGDGSVQVFQGDCSERERGKIHGVQQGKSL